jgi:cytochrome c-type biogenesis protein CcmE
MIEPNQSSGDDSSTRLDGGAAKAGDGVALPVRTRRHVETDDDAQTRRRGLLIAVPLVGVAAAIAGLVLTGMKDNAIYSKPVDELIAQKAKFAGRPVRAEGNLVHGSLMKREQPCEYRFTISKNGTEVPVRYAQCVVPDTFRDVPGMDVGVTVEGQLLSDSSFEATTVLAKCPSKYEMKDRAQKGEKMPHLATEVAETPAQGSAVGTRAQ